jgi:hypothetical protein
MMMGFSHLGRDVSSSNIVAFLFSFAFSVLEYLCCATKKRRSSGLSTDDTIGSILFFFYSFSALDVSRSLKEAKRLFFLFLLFLPFLPM